MCVFVYLYTGEVRLRRQVRTKCDLTASMVAFDVGFQKIDIDFFEKHAKCPVGLFFRLQKTLKQLLHRLKS